MECKNCKKELVPKKGRVLNTKRKFCNDLCRGKYNHKKNYNRKRHNKDFRKKNNTRFKKWYANNKQKQKDSVLKNYFNNKIKWDERRYTCFHRIKLLKLLKKECHLCHKKEIKIIHHKTYNLPKRKKGYKTENEINNYLKKYAKFLLGFCSRECHCEYHRKRKKPTKSAINVQKRCKKAKVYIPEDSLISMEKNTISFLTKIKRHSLTAFRILIPKRIIEKLDMRKNVMVTISQEDKSSKGEDLKNE